MVNSLNDMDSQVQQWYNEKPSFVDGTDLRVGQNDIVIFNFASNGDDGDKLIKIYRSHTYSGVGKYGGKFTDARFCPRQSGLEGIECPNCAAGHSEIKERMSIWMYVRNHLHAQQPKDKAFPQVQYENKVFFNEEVNDWRVWHTSAWKESPWGDIIKMFNLYQGLHNFTAQLSCTGNGINTRYKVYPMPNSEALVPELKERARQECEPIPQILLKDLLKPVPNGNVQQAPQTGQQLPSNTIGGAVPFVAPGVAVPVFGAPSAVQSASFASTVQPEPQTTQPASQIQPLQAAPVQDIQTLPEEEQRRPMKNLF